MVSRNDFRVMTLEVAWYRHLLTLPACGCLRGMEAVNASEKKRPGIKPGLCLPNLCREKANKHILSDLYHSVTLLWLKM